MLFRSDAKEEKKRLKEEKKQSKKKQQVSQSKETQENTEDSESKDTASKSADSKISAEVSEAESNADGESDDKGRLFVINFDGDVEASAVENMREEITAIISAADKNDHVLVRLESPGGMVHSYGLAASQLSRIKDANLKLIIAVDEVAASGGYMMACVADEIIAAPFAIVGSIGEIGRAHV